MAISLYYIFIYNNQKVTNIREMAIKDFFCKLMKIQRLLYCG
ncbi:hypothetical protein C7379_102174 [Hallella colorans]|uniref:Uncharacterized protein n=1 Tax=Hallella colorans TaxID=1703337 RepID=A0A2U0UM52_9BACT|nr:hypothetical protein C7379_102174 [Hallella colorans]